VLMGHSAGAHLVGLAALSGATGPVAGLIINDSLALDVPALAASRGGRLDGLWARAFGQDPVRWQALSPSAHLARGALPPALVTWSGEDGRDILIRRFAARYRQAGGPVTLFDGSQYGHPGINRAIGGRRDSGISPAIAAFLQGL
jgi:arylformamidase